MSLRPRPIGPVPEQTARVARAACPKGNAYTRMRNGLGTIFEDGDFAGLFLRRGQPVLAPWRLALVTVMPFAENLPDRQAADAVRARIDWKFALSFELTDPGFDFSVLSEFQDRLLAGGAEQLLPERMLERFAKRGWVKARGTQRTDSTHVLSAVRPLNRIEQVDETMRVALNALAIAAPEWLRERAPEDWFISWDSLVRSFEWPVGTGGPARSPRRRVGPRPYPGARHAVAGGPKRETPHPGSRS